MFLLMVIIIIIYSKGDYGDKFYIILDGVVSVLVPRKKEKKDEDQN